MSRRQRLCRPNLRPGLYGGKSLRDALESAGNIKSKKILAAAASVLAVEARHAGWIRDLNNVNGAPAAFQAPKTKPQVLAAVKGTGFIVG